MVERRPIQKAARWLLWLCPGVFIVIYAVAARPPPDWLAAVVSGVGVASGIVVFHWWEGTMRAARTAGLGVAINGVIFLPAVGNLLRSLLL